MKTGKITVNELFSGIGAQVSALERLGIPCEIKHTSDIDHNAVLAYASIHCGLTEELINTYTEYPTREEMAKQLTEINLGYDFQKNKPYNWYRFVNSKSKELEKYWLANKLSRNLGDISKIDKLEYADFWTISFCCQDISNAGKMKGFKLGSNTRSSLLWDNIKLLKLAVDSSNAPKYVMFENVKNLVSKKFMSDFNDLLDVLNELGYNTYWKVLNAKDYGIPQNRERVFAISIRKDIDDGKFEFPQPFDNGVRLKDVLEDKVDEKYYLTDTMIRGFIKHNDNHTTKGTGFIWKPRDVNGTASTLRANSALAPTDNTILETNHCVEVGSLSGGKWDKIYESARRYYSSVNLEQPNSKTRRGRVGKGCAQTLTTSCNQGVIEPESKSFRVRKLTPRECYRLMGFTDEQFDKSQAFSSDSQLYKQAGNSIVVDVLYYIFGKLFEVDTENFT